MDHIGIQYIWKPQKDIKYIVNSYLLKVGSKTAFRMAIVTALLALLGFLFGCSSASETPPAVSPPVPDSPSSEKSSGSTPTAIPTATPTVLTVPTPTNIPPATPTPIPTMTPTPIPTATPVPPPTSTPTPIVQGFVYDQFNFVLRLDNEVELTVLGWTAAVADETQGLLAFDHGGTNAFILWILDGSFTTTQMLSETYQILQIVEPDWTFTPISEGSIEISGVIGEFGGFALTDNEGEAVGGGLIGAWKCPGTSTVMSATIISPTATTLQVRFNRLLQGIECSS